jgi:hypothetical protein
MGSKQNRFVFQKGQAAFVVIKKLICESVVLALGVQSAASHQMEGGSKAGLFGLKPEHIHVLINPLPV